MYIWNMKAVHICWDLLKLLCQNKSVDKVQFVTLTFDLQTQKFIGFFLLPSCIYVWNMKAAYIENYSFYRLIKSEPKC